MKRGNCLFLISLIAAAGCGPTIHVQIPHILSVQLSPSDAERYRAVQNVYLLVEKSTTFTLDAWIFAKELNRSLERRGGRFVAFRVAAVDPAAIDPYTAELEPSGILRLRFSSFTLKKTEQKKEKKDDKGNVTQITTWKYDGAMIAHAQFVSAPSGALFFEQSLSVSFDQEFAAPTDSNDRTAQRALEERLIDALTTRMSPLSTVLCERPLFKVKDDEESAAALKQADRARWTEAEQIWRTRLEEGRGGWRDSLGLAVSAEHRGDYPVAGRLYREAEEKSRDDADAAKIAWSSFHEQIARVSTAPALSAGARSWYGRRVAVLPFSDETVSIDGPDLIHRMVFSTFKDGGYSAIALEDVASTLTSHGFTDGAHLVAVKPEKLAQWLKADWLVYGHIEDFNEVNIGVYLKRSIAGKIWIWDAQKRAEIWSSQRPIKKDGFVEGNILANFLGNLGKSWLERLGKAPMAGEVCEFVENNVESLPHRPH